MSKVLTIAFTEYLNAVRSKAFIVGIIMMPIMMGAGLIMQVLSESNVDIQERKFAVLDESGELYDYLEEALEARNSGIYKTGKIEFKGLGAVGEGLEVESSGGGESASLEEDELAIREQYLPAFSMEKYEHGDESRSAELVLSDRVRNGELFAFVVIGKNILAERTRPKDQVYYYSASSTYKDLSKWIRSTIQDKVEDSRFAAKGIDLELVADLQRLITFDARGLVEESIDGEEVGGEEDNDIQSFAIPFGSVMLLFMLIMMSAPQALNVVLEEKMQKISEVLVSAVTPFQLMLGKLAGTILLSMTLSLVYLGSIFIATHYFEMEAMIPMRIYAWFLLFQLMAMAIFSSLFAAVGAACSEIRDAQSLITPGMMILMIPMFFLVVVLKSPDSALAVGLSLFPPATPMLMMLRVAIDPGPPMWQLILSVILTAGFTVGCVWAAGKVFRIGLLSSGQAPTLKNLVGWVFSK